jgi:hypothetical protein
MRESDLVSARKHYSKFQDSEIPRHIAMGARLYLEERDFDRAKILLKKAFTAAARKKAKHNRYVCEYCDYYLRRMNGDEDAEDYRLTALAIKPSSSLIDALPLFRREKFEDRNMVEAKHQAEKS